MISLKKGSLALIALIAVSQMARADSLEDQVLNDSGPTYDTFDWNPDTGSGSVASGDFTLVGSPVQTEFSPALFSDSGFYTNPNISLYPSTFSSSAPADGQNVTDINDPNGQVDPGTLYLNIDSSDNSGSLYEYIDTGYANGETTPTMVPLFISSNLLGFGQVGTMDEYWFAFESQGSIIGGNIQPDGGDIKTFFVVPTPTAAVAGLGLIGLMSGLSLRKKSA